MFHWRRDVHFHSIRLAELADTVTLRDEISVDCAKHVPPCLDLSNGSSPVYGRPKCYPRLLGVEVIDVCFWVF